MVLCGSIFMCYLISLCSSDINNGICNESGKREIVCCADYYRDFVSGSCLPCIGSFGHNCLLTCSDGYFGHGCRSKCECNDSQTCEPHIGCTYDAGSTLNTRYLVVAIACVGSMLITGVAMFTGRNILQKFKANSGNKSQMEKREDRILYENASSSEMIDNPLYSSQNGLQSLSNSYGGTIIDHNGESQECQRQKKVVLVPLNTESGYSEIDTCSTNHHPSGRALLLKYNVVGDDCIEAISDRCNRPHRHQQV